MLLYRGPVDRFVERQNVNESLEMRGERTKGLSRPGRNVRIVSFSAQHKSSQWCDNRLRSPTRISFGFINESAQGLAQGVRELLGDIEAQPHLAQFNLADVSAMDTSDFGKLLLEYPLRFPMP